MNNKLLCSLVTSFVICLIASTGCKKTNTAPSVPNAPSSSAPPSGADLSHAEGGTAPPTLAQVKYFKGSIGNSLDLQMKLIQSGDQLTGSYYYQKIGTKIELKGTLDKEGNVVLQEFDTKGKQTGLFRGIWTTAPDDGLVSIAGNWSKPTIDNKADEKKTAFSIHEEPIALSGDAEVTTKQIKESNKKLVYEISAQYPQITGGANGNFEKFNQTVRGTVLKNVAAFKKEVQPGTGDEPRPENSMGSDLNISYKMGLAQDDLVSVSFAISSYYQGAAHPSASSEVVNYDLKNGKVLKLSDVFKPSVKYLPVLSSYCIEDLKKQSKQKGSDGMLDDTSIKGGAAPTANNYQSWTITRKGLGIIFDPYQVGPYAAGAQFVTVPYSTLKELINPDGPLGQFVR